MLSGIDLSTTVAMEEVCEKLKANENLKSLSLRSTNLSDSSLEVLAHKLSEFGFGTHLMVCDHNFISKLAPFATLREKPRSKLLPPTYDKSTANYINLHYG